MADVGLMLDKNVYDRVYPEYLNRVILLSSSLREDIPLSPTLFNLEIEPFPRAFLTLV